MRYLPSLLLARRLRRSAAVAALALVTLTGTVAPAAVPAAHALNLSTGTFQAEGVSAAPALALNNFNFKKGTSF